MTSLRYKFLEKALRWSGLTKKIAKTLKSGTKLSTKPNYPVKRRWTRSEFQGRNIWTCSPKSGATGKIYIHQHGGAYAMGLIDLHYWTMTRLSDMSGTTVIMPDYPLVGEAGSDEIIQFALDHWQSCLDEYGFDNLKLGGDSAGGHLALTIAQMAQTPPDELLLLSPWVDMELSDLNGDIPLLDPILGPVSLKAAGKRFMGSRDPRDPVISPRFADPLSLPQMYIFTGEKDLLHASIMDFAARSKAVGKINKLAVFGEFGHYWMFYPTPDRESTLVELAEIVSS